MIATQASESLDPFGVGRHLLRCCDHVLRRPRPPDRRFILFGRGRSGTTALVSLLDGVQHLHCDGEILNRPVLFPRLHVHARSTHADANVYGCKILSYQIRSVQPLWRRHQFLQRLSSDGFRVVYLRRENLVKHAVSNIRARAYGFHRRRHDGPALEKIRIDPADALAWTRSSEALFEYESLLLQGVPHLPLAYEKDLENERDHQGAVDAICGFLGIDSSPVASSFRKVSPPRLRDSIGNYDEVAAHLGAHGYGCYLD